MAAGDCYLGVDVGSVSACFACVDPDTGAITGSAYVRTEGRPVEATRKGFMEIRGGVDGRVLGVGVTGSGRNLVGAIIGADVRRNEITAHSTSVMHLHPDAQTIFEIGGQDSKIILLRNGIPVDFAMNTVCAAGTGSFLDQQAVRLGIPIEEFGARALRAARPAKIGGRCTVFAESDMIQRQQLGYSPDEIIAGLCDALVRNYLNNVARGKELIPPFVFQGGVASNIGIREAFAKELDDDVFVPDEHQVMGAYGIGLLVRRLAPAHTAFRGWEVNADDILTRTFECTDCSNVCDIVQIQRDGATVGCMGSRCQKWTEHTLPG